MLLLPVLSLVARIRLRVVVANEGVLQLVQFIEY